MCKAMKGGLHLDEEYCNGSCFVVELPGGVSLESPKEIRRKSITASWSSLSTYIPRSMKILLIDDCLPSSNLLQRRLERAVGPLQSLVVQSVLTGEDALRLLEQSHSDEKDFDVVVIDQNMHSAGGVLLGHEVVRQIRGRLNLQRTVVIGCTGNAATCRTVKISHFAFKYLLLGCYRC